MGQTAMRPQVSIIGSFFFHAGIGVRMGVEVSTGGMNLLNRVDTSRSSAGHN